MRESGYYPAGAEFDKNAPYNQEGLPEKTFHVVTYQTLRAEGDILTDKYTGLEVEKDPDDGSTYEYVDTSDMGTDEWKDVWTDKYYTVAQLLDMFADKLIEELPFLSSKQKEKEHLRMINNIRMYKEDSPECDYFNEE